jgi:hypothetical protein
MIAESEKIHEPANKEIWKLRRDYCEILLLQLGDVHRRKGHFKDAEVTHKDILQRPQETTTGNVPYRTRIMAFRALAWVYEEQRDFSQREANWHAALQSALESWGPSDELTVYYIALMENSFRAQGEDPASWLQQRFALVRGPGGNLVQSAAVNTHLSIPTE